jgi:nucleotide-binding universal stress UspA family protein
MAMTVNKPVVTNGRAKAFRPGEPFRLIVVGVDDSEEALEAIRQAGALAGPGSTVELVAVGIADAPSVLQRAEAELAHSPARVVVRALEGHHAWKVLLAEAASADLIVVGKHVSSRLCGYVAGSTATHVVHHAHLPVLVAVKPVAGTFLSRVLVAAGPESEHPELPVATAAAIARRAGGELVLLRVDWSRARMTPGVARLVEEYEETTGKPIDDVILGGDPHHEIVRAAERESASLVVVGSRELGGAAMRSVSERVAHEAACSVLVMHRHSR